jgi:hypothetical protein
LIFLTNIDHQWDWLNLTGVRNQTAFSQTLRLQDAVCTALSGMILEAPSGPDASMPTMAPMAAPAISANLSSLISMLSMAFHSHSYDAAGAAVDTQHGRCLPAALFRAEHAQAWRSSRQIERGLGGRFAGLFGFEYERPEGRIELERADAPFGVEAHLGCQLQGRVNQAESTLQKLLAQAARAEDIDEMLEAQQNRPAVGSITLDPIPQGFFQLLHIGVRKAAHQDEATAVVDHEPHGQR